ncbi:MAG: DUF4389 domain-containing protein [Alteromonadaceae bacterium]|nr:DUF4389 domain-containing protein [Alteromonadaceae bacterium]
MSYNTYEHEEKMNKSRNVFKRGFAMLFFGFLAGFARVGITFIAVFQFIALLVTEKPNKALQEFGAGLNNYIFQINEFLIVNSEKYPFPLSGWPTNSNRHYE